MIIHNFALNFLLFFLRLSLFYNFMQLWKIFNALNFYFQFSVCYQKVLSYFSVCLQRLFNDVVVKCVARVLLLLFTPHNTSYYHYYYI